MSFCLIKHRAMKGYEQA